MNAHFKTPAVSEGLDPMDRLELQVIDLTHKAVALSVMADVVKKLVFSQLPFTKEDETFAAFFHYADDILNDALRAREALRAVIEAEVEATS